jgi:hypothetical protein
MIFGRKERVPAVGDEVMTSEEEHLGQVTSVTAETLEVTGGTSDHPHVWHVPRSAVSRVDDEGVALSLSRAQVLVLD